MTNDTLELRITPSDLAMILAGLSAISPSGGGSAQFTLYRALGALLPNRDMAHEQTLAGIPYEEMMSLVD